jgi:hypothetical protein
MSELPLSEGFLLTVFGMFIGCFSGALACILKSRCTKITCGCFTIERNVIPPNDLQNVSIDIPPNPTRS